ncbi:hypothetical protein Patl1_10483 [Pistacia atlantica]|uniref:Uncharacterized protein n=1 Tax=Pistacia atlantica TaxID=434234 RepID=A0ACC1A6D0_9ROSI|nr:hypothetical protein Patl1_10483 [Pistacia atlantica]
MKWCNPIEGLKEAYEKLSSPRNSSEEVSSTTDLKKVSELYYIGNFVYMLKC